MRLKERIEILREKLQNASPDQMAALEQEARELLSESKNTPVEQDAQALFAELAKLNKPEAKAVMASRKSGEKPSLEGLLRRARIRIEMAGDADDIDEALDILSEALATKPENERTIKLMQEAAAHNEQAAMRVRDLFTRYEIDAPVMQPKPAEPEPPQKVQPAPDQPPTDPPQPERLQPRQQPPQQPESQPQQPPQQPPVAPQEPPASPLPIEEETLVDPPELSQRQEPQRPVNREPTQPIPLDELESPSPPRYGGQPYIPQVPQSQQEPLQQPAPQQPSPVVGPDVDDLMSELTESYYAGNYQQTVDIANRLLSRDPHNAAAQDYRQKAEDNIIRGVVPDHRIPFEARVSYNRANSLVRAGNYEEAAKLYREAREVAERSGVLNWNDVEQALLDIQDLALARELMNEGDRLIAADNWQEAQRKYEGALRVVPNDPQAEERLDMIRSVQRDVDSISVDLNMLGGTLEEQVDQLRRIRSKLSRVRQLLPTSQRLAEMQQTVEGKLDGVQSQLKDQARSTFERANNTTTIDDRLNLLSDIVTLMEFAIELEPSDREASNLLSEARSQASTYTRARQNIERASSLISQNYDSELPQARAMLAEMTNFSQDERYRSTVNELFTRYLERAEVLLEEGNIREARQWIDAMREEPFRILGRRSDVARLDAAMRGRRTRGRIFTGGIIGIIFIGLAALGFAAREPIAVAFFPTQTPSPTLTYTPSASPTASLTYTPSATYTPSLTPTSTPTGTWTWTPSPTWTPSWTPTATLTPTHTNTPTPTSTFTNTPTPTQTYTPTQTPSITPTPSPICLAVVVVGEGARLREEPTLGSRQLLTVEEDQTIEIIGQEYGAGSNFIWYDVRITLDNGSQVFGYLREDTVSVFSPSTGCPDLPPPGQ
jgi:tetratricopeptide (TPR) repeat protein